MKINLDLHIALWILFFIGLFVFAFIVTKKNGSKEHGNLLDEIVKVRQNMIRELSIQDSSK